MALTKENFAAISEGLNALPTSELQKFTSGGEKILAMSDKQIVKLFSQYRLNVKIEDARSAIGFVKFHAAKIIATRG